MKTEAGAPTRTITAERIPEGKERVQLLSRHFARHFLTVVDSILLLMRRVVPKQHAESWHFYELSNGAVYMAPDLEVALRVQNLVTGEFREMSADATGLAVSLLAFRYLSTQIRNDVMVRHYYQLREFAIAHPESTQVLAIVD